MSVDLDNPAKQTFTVDLTNPAKQTFTAMLNKNKDNLRPTTYTNITIDADDKKGEFGRTVTIMKPFTFFYKTNDDLKSDFVDIRDVVIDNNGGGKARRLTRKSSRGRKTRNNRRKSNKRRR